MKSHGWLIHYLNNEKAICDFCGLSSVIEQLSWGPSTLRLGVMAMKTAVIGLGNIGRQLETNLIAGGQELIVADHGAEKAEAFAKGAPGNSRPAPVAAAI